MLTGVQVHFEGCGSQNQQPELRANLQRPIEHAEIHFPKRQHWVWLSSSQTGQQNASVTRYVIKIKLLALGPEQGGEFEGVGVG